MKKFNPILIILLFVGSIHNANAQKAIATTWTGSVETDIVIADFYNEEFTLAIRFLPQYIYSYKAPLVSSGNTNTFSLGLADHFATKDSTKQKLYLKIGTKTAIYETSYSSNQWSTLVLRSDRSQKGVVTYDLFLDGQKQSPVNQEIVENIWKAPIGKILLGKDGLNKTGSQYYGLLDDVAIFNKRLSQLQISSLSLTPDFSNSLVIKSKHLLHYIDFENNNSIKLNEAAKLVLKTKSYAPTFSTWRSLEGNSRLR